MRLQIYVDASSYDDGISKYGYVIKNGTTVLAEGSGFYPGGFTSVPAEHISADLAFRVIKLFCRKLKERVEHITLYTDEENIVKDNRRPRMLKAISHKAGLTEHYNIPIDYKWIPSQENEADRLVANPERRRKDNYFRSQRLSDAEQT